MKERTEDTVEDKFYMAIAAEYNPFKPYNFENDDHLAKSESKVLDHERIVDVPSVETPPSVARLLNKNKPFLEESKERITE